MSSSFYHDILILCLTCSSLLLAIIEYLDRTYLPIADQFATWSTNLNRNYGVKVTSRTEGAHSALKQHLKSKNGNLVHVKEATSKLVFRQRSAYEERLSHQDRVLPACRGKRLYSFVRHIVSQQALRLVLIQER